MRKSPFPSFLWLKYVLRLGYTDELLELENFLLPQHMVQRHGWCFARRNWDEFRWAGIVFSDEKGVTANGMVRTWVHKARWDQPFASIQQT